MDWQVPAADGKYYDVLFIGTGELHTVTFTFFDLAIILEKSVHPTLHLDGSFPGSKKTEPDGRDPLQGVAPHR